MQYLHVNESAAHLKRTDPQYHPLGKVVPLVEMAKANFKHSCNTSFIISNIYIPPTSSCTGGYQLSLDHLMTTDTLLLGDVNAHQSSWLSSSTNTRSINLENTINGTNFGILNWDTPTRLPSNTTPSSPDVSLTSASLITSSNWQTKTTMGSDHLPILISLQMAPSSTHSLYRNYVNPNPCPSLRDFN